MVQGVCCSEHLVTWKMAMVYWIFSSELWL